MVRSSDVNSKLALVTGANGFIGRTLCRCLLEKGFRVHGLVRAESDVAPIPDDVEVFRAELDDNADIRTACVGMDVIFHTAGIAHVRTPSPGQLHNINVEGTHNVLAAGAQEKVSRFILISSILASRPDTPYGRSKQLAEQAVMEQAEHFQSVTILRPVNVYGPGMKGNIAGLIYRIRSGSLPPLPRLNNHLSLVSVEDLCHAAILAAEKPEAAGQVYTVTDGQRYSPNSLESAIYATLERVKPKWHSPRVVFYAASLAAQLLNSLGIWNNDLGLRTYRNLVDNSEDSCEKITTELGYQPSCTFEDELPSIISMLERK